MDLLQRQFSLYDMPVFVKKFLSGDKKLVKWRTAGLSSCVMKRGQNDLNFPCRIKRTALAICPYFNTFLCLDQLLVHQLPYGLCNMHPNASYIRRGLSLLHVFATFPLVCTDLDKIYEQNCLTFGFNWQEQLDKQTYYKFITVLPSVKHWRPWRPRIWKHLSLSPQTFQMVSDQ